MSDLRSDVEAWLRETGLSWDIESGGKHLKVKLAGRLVGIFPRDCRTGGGTRARLNIRAQIRRAAREQAA